MDFQLNEERQMLSDTLRRFSAEKYDFGFRSSLAHDAPYHSPERWQDLAEIGVIGIFVTEEQGGYGGSAFDLCVVFEELGRGLCPEPMLAALLTVRLLANFDQSALVEQAIGAEKRFALGVFEPEASENLTDIQTQANQAGDSWSLSGRKSVVYGAPGADALLVVAKCNDGLGLFLTDRAEQIDFAMIDGGGASEVMLDDTPAQCISQNAEAQIENALNAGRLALCAEAVGVMDALLPMTIEYLKQRVQFGQPISNFQVLQHRIVDLATELEMCRAIVISAASRLGTENESKYVSMAKNLIGRAGTKMAEEVIQLHGGIGMTWEYPGSHYAKRLTMIDHQLGDKFSQIQRVAGII